MAAVLREPLAHFVLLGALIFLLNALFGDAPPERTERTIVLDESDVSRLAEQYRRTWMRPPTPTELGGLLAEAVREEILYREALALGLDQDDPIVRRRLRQKMEFLNADLLADVEPTDAELAGFLAADAERFRRPARYSLAQVFIDPTRHPDPAAYATTLLALLNATAASGAALDPAEIGDPTLLPEGLDLASPRDIAETFGRDFADAVPELEPGAWRGPLRSGYGLHLVRIAQVEPGGLPPLAEIREQVIGEWQHARRQQAEERFYEALRERWTVEIKHPATSAAAGADATVTKP